MSESDCRALHRWRIEGAATSLWKADAFLIRYGSHIEEFILHCDRAGLPVWACDQPPAWLGEDLSWQDLASSDARWRAEARAALKREGA